MFRNLFRSTTSSRAFCILRALSQSIALSLVVIGVVDAGAEETPLWQPLETINKPHARHEAAFVECDGRFYLLGGRRVQPVDIFDPATRTWSEGSRPPIEIHHFQPVVWDHQIWLAGWSLQYGTVLYSYEKSLQYTVL